MVAGQGHQGHHLLPVHVSIKELVEQGGAVGRVGCFSKSSKKALHKLFPKDNIEQNCV